MGKWLQYFSYMSFFLSLIPWTHIVLVISRTVVGSPDIYTSWIYSLFLSPVLSMGFGLIGLKEERGRIFGYFGMGISILYSFIIGTVAFVAIVLFNA